MNRREFLRDGAIAAVLGWLGVGGTAKAKESELERLLWASADKIPNATVVLRAQDHPYTTVWLNDRDVSDDATACSAAPNPNEVAWGWVDLVEKSENGCIRAGSNDEPLQARHFGLVKWAPMERRQS